MLSHCRRVRREVTRYDVALLACRALDTYSDVLVIGNVIFFIAEVTHLNDVVTGAVMGIFDFAMRVYIAVHAGRLQDGWPSERMFALTALTKFLAAFTALAMAAVPVFVANQSIAALVVCLLLTVLYGASEAYSGNIYLKMITHVNSVRRSAELDRLLFSFSYAVANLAGAMARLTMVAVREWFAPNFATADTVIVLAGATALAASGLVAASLDRRMPARSDQAPVKDAKTEGAFAWSLLARFAVFIATMLGVDFVYEQFNMMLPKFLVRRYGFVTLYPAFQAINPFLIFFLAPTLCVAVRHWELVPLLVGSTFAIALATGTMGLVDSPWIVALALIVCTVGEAMGLAQVDAYVTTEVLSPDQIGRYQALATLPRGLIAFGSSTLSGVLLNAYCPPNACTVASARVLWLIVGAVGLLTPLLFLVQSRFKRNKT